MSSGGGAASSGVPREPSMENQDTLEEHHDDSGSRKRSSSEKSSQLTQRPKKGHFQKSCLAACHSTSVHVFGHVDGEGSNLNNTRVFHQKLLGWAKTQLPQSEKTPVDRSTWMCSACIAYGKASTSGVSEDDIILNAEDKYVDFIVKRMQQNVLSSGNMSRLVDAIGSICQSEISKLSSRPRPGHADLHQSYMEIWNSNNFVVTKPLLESMSKFSNVVSARLPSAHRYLQKALENLCRVSHPRYISPTAAAESIFLHAVTGSRAACDIYSCSNASGGHTFITNLITSIGTEPPEFPTGDIYVAFDNQQVIGKEYRVSAGGAQKTSVVTNFAVYQERLPVNVQRKFEMLTLPPIPSSNPAALWTLFQKQEDLWINMHRRYRNDWIKTRLQIAKRLQEFDDSNLENDDVRAIILGDDYERGLEYSIVPPVASSCTVTDMECLELNPNSIVTVGQVLDKLLEMNNKSDPARKWFSVYCDGLPYGIAAKLIQSTYICDTCKKTGLEVDILKHECDTIKCSRKYEKILLRPGAGHIEVNLVRTIFREFFDVYIRPIAQKLGFVTFSSMEYCKAALDHHKSWQILKIIFVALSDELIYLYSRERSSVDFSEESFSRWKSGQTNPNVLLAFDFAFTILHSLFLFRSSVRQCNDTVAYAALFKASSLFFGFNHPKYREIISRDIFLDICSPSEGFPTARKLSFKLESSDFGQGLDFLLEERNKLQKNWLIAVGVPSTDQWKRASACLPEMEAIGETVKKNLEWKPPKSDKPRLKFGNEYLVARQHFRKVLSKLEPYLHSLNEDKVPLNPKFANCSVQCQENMSSYFRCYIQGKKCVLNVASFEQLQEKSFEEVKKVAKRQLRPLSGSLKADFESRLSLTTDVNEVVEIIGDIEYHIAEMDWSFENS